MCLPLRSKELLYFLCMLYLLFFNICRAMKSPVSLFSIKYRTTNLAKISLFISVVNILHLELLPDLLCKITVVS